MPRWPAGAPAAEGASGYDQRPALGLLIKAAVEDAVRAGKLSGTTAVDGLRALGLDRKFGAPQPLAARRRSDRPAVKGLVAPSSKKRP